MEGQAAILEHLRQQAAVLGQARPRAAAGTPSADRSAHHQARRVMGHQRA